MVPLRSHARRSESREPGRRSLLFRLAVLVLAIAGPAEGQRAVHELFGMDRGLTSLSITSWAQDNRGFVWVGTEGGLFRFDGSQFRRYGEEDGLPHELVMGLGVTPEGNLWVSTYGGLAWKKSARFERPEAMLLNGPLTAQAVAFRMGKVYFATHLGVATGDWPPDKDGLKLTLLPGPVERRDRLAKAITVGPDGDVWWSCGRGLCRFGGKRLEQFGPAQGVPADDYLSLAIDRQGKIWARSRGTLLGMADGGSRFEVEGGGYVGTTSVGYAQLTIDPDGRLLVGSVKGLAIRERGGWRLVNANNGLPVSGVSGAWSDREGSLWIGLSGAGLARLPGYKEWTSFAQQDGLDGDIVTGLGQSADGRIWVATSTGLWVAQSPGATPKWSQVSVPGMEMINTMSQAWDGSLLLAGSNQRVLRLRPETGQWTSYSRVAGNVSGAMLDKKGRLWVFGTRGLFRTKEGSTVLERLDEDIPRDENSRSKALFFTGAAAGEGEDEAWITTYGGLLHYQKGRWRWLREADGLRTNVLATPSLDPAGRLWVAYRDVGGASRVEYRGGKYEVVSIEGPRGAQHDFIYSFHFPQTGGMWALTSSGVQILKAGRWVRLDRSDGLLWDECSQGSLLRASDGSYWIGTSRGVSRYEPRIEPEPADPPAAAISEVRWGGKSVEPERGVNLKVDGRAVQVRFSILEFRHSTRHRVRYRVNGRDWVETSDRSLSMEQLAAGRHRVEVKAGSVEAGWNEVAEVLEFEVAPRWYELWWIRLLASLASLAMVMVIWRLRNRRLESARRALERAVEVRTEQLSREKRKVEEQHEQIGRLLEQALEASRLKSEFLANMSHEIRTPMNAILGLMSLTLESSLEEKQREQLEGARSAAVSLMGVLTDILDLSKIEAGRFELSTAPFDLHRLVSSVHSLFTHEAEAKGLELEMHLGLDVPVWVEGDKDRMRQVLVNLMSNALKFTEQGRVSVSAHAGPERGGRREISIAVEDTGIGIAEEHRELIFEGFRQADGSITRRFGGTGLGLAISKKIVDGMGGRIEMRSRLGRGSRFTVVLPMPAVREPVQMAVAAPAPGIESEKLRVLVAEDNLLNQKVAQRVLEKRGHEVVLASTGLLALAAMARQDFDVVVMDLQMPEMDGIEATRRLRRDGGPKSTIPVLGFTASALPEDREACMAAGMNGLVNKPVEPKLLISEVERLGRGRKESAAI
ncbi:MAG: hypothetical protein C0504_10820 [Candidatus Solibacter sp.]|nr:hypothetical protein [Candidatus Solibacter sp.]